MYCRILIYLPVVAVSLAKDNNQSGNQNVKTTKEVKDEKEGEKYEGEDEQNSWRPSKKPTVSKKPTTARPTKAPKPKCTKKVSITFDMMAIYMYMCIDPVFWYVAIC